MESHFLQKPFVVNPHDHSFLSKRKEANNDQFCLESMLFNGKSFRFEKLFVFRSLPQHKQPLVTVFYGCLYSTPL